MDIIGVLVGIGFFVGSLWCGYRAIYLRRAYQSITGHNAGAQSSIVNGNEATVRGNVVVDEQVDAGNASDALLPSTSQPALLVWRIRRSNPWKTVGAGIETGEFRIRDGTDDIRVDTSWLTERHGGNQLSAVTKTDLKKRGPRTKLPWQSPFLDMNTRPAKCMLDETTVLEPDVHADIGDEQERYQISIKSVYEGDTLTVHGHVVVDQGTPIIRGTNDVPMMISDREPAVLGAHIRTQLLRICGYAIGLVVLSAGILYAAGAATLL